MHGISHILDACMTDAFGVVVHHILFVLEDRGDGQSEPLGSLVREGFACLDVEDVWRAILRATLAL